ncbi:MAG: L-threonylcarbamoyladenylate synthase, partial [Cellulosilyticaceae bacterium]
MNTLIISDLTQLPKAAHLLQKGGLVATPTETVYGLAADAFNPDAVVHIFEAKGRPSDNPLIVHIASLETLDELALSIPPNAKLLMDAFWPGPLTLIFDATDQVPAVVRGGLPTVAVRFPSHP